MKEFIIYCPSISPSPAIILPLDNFDFPSTATKTDLSFLDTPFAQLFRPCYIYYCSSFTYITLPYDLTYNQDGSSFPISLAEHAVTG